MGTFSPKAACGGKTIASSRANSAFARALRNASAITLGGVLLSSCVASSIDTAGFSQGAGIGSTDAVLALDSASLPNPTIRPSADLVSSTLPANQSEPDTGGPETQVSSDTTASPSPTELAAATPAVETKAEATAAANPTAADETGDNANNRIATAANAPTVSASPAATAPPVTVAAATPPVEQPSEPQAALAPASEPRKKTGLFAALFANPDTKKPTPPASVAKAEPKPQVIAKASAVPVNRERAVIATASARGSLNSLPGVDKKRAIGVPEADQDDSGEIEIASAGGLARLAPNGLKTQHGGVDVKCLKPALVRVLKQVERKYGKSAIVTSGYRSPSHNKKVRGAKKSLHMYCAAADIQVPGVSKWDLASYMRSMPGRGGVGTYCHTNSVHIDIGPRRDWNWRCRRR